MALNFLPRLCLGLLALCLSTYAFATALPQNGPIGQRIPVLYEAYYPEPRQWNPRTNFQEIERLRELTSQLLRVEDQLAAGYVFPENAPARFPVEAPVGPVLAPRVDDKVQVASLTISDVGPQHKTRHHHGQANWLLRRLARSPNAY